MYEQPSLDGEREARLRELKERGIASFAIYLHEEERQAIERFTVTEGCGDFDYFGENRDDLKQTLIAHLRQFPGNEEETIKSIAELVTRLVDQMKADFEQSAAWITLRTFLPSADHDVPRWHQDGRYLQDEKGESLPGDEYKLVYSPKGAPTLFQDFQETEGRATIYRVGTPDSPVHSEPPIRTPRIFISIVPGPKEAIQDLQKRFCP